ncbi:hypothetical protein BGW36DRAFT_392055 [Talaromyces proteolyticus]|uniref:Zn(2)-C6 fungal-type domain-containing protein n=1 Tax=Talaromyces proteolyticus TaxID=1131652 RepID=A0AAD4KG52_9EURO|nr:uncharacterized protein BGW36DRAFT_392055 [Talaromyces proteolyticus]KAH8688706.1 hypothetical protein BGW36DRAFT_392055 [Talaromyces proteolyticus]
MHENLVPRRTQFSSCDACRRSRVACDAMKGRSALTSAAWMNACTRCLNRGRQCTFEWIQNATLPNSKRKFVANRRENAAYVPTASEISATEAAVNSPPSTDAQSSGISMQSTDRCGENGPAVLSADHAEWLRGIYESIFEDVFGSWLGNYSCPYVFRDNRLRDRNNLALSVSISSLCRECDQWMKRVQGQGMSPRNEEVESPGEIDRDRQIDYSLSRAIYAFSARWLPLTEHSGSVRIGLMDTIESLWREVRRDILRVINRPCYRSALTLFLFALTPIPAGISEEEEIDGVPAQFCVQAALQQVLTLRALQRSLEFNGSKVSSISPILNAITSPTPVTKDFLGIESMVYWAAMTFDTSSSLTLNTKSLLSPGLVLGAELESSWRLVRTCTNIFHEETKDWRAEGVHITEERANQIIASASSWKLFVWKAAAVVKEALREGQEEEAVQQAFRTAIDAVNQFSLTYRELLAACERRIQFFGHKTKLRWYELILHYNLSILIMLDAVEIAGRMDLIEKTKVVKADAEGSLMNCLIFGLNNDFYVSRQGILQQQLHLQNSQEDDEHELNKRVPLIVIDPYPHHVVAGVRILWKAVERNLENNTLDQSTAEHMHGIMLQALRLLPQASKSVRTARQQAEAAYIL